MSQVALQAGDFCTSNKEYFYSPLDGMLLHHRATPHIKISLPCGTHLYTRLERETTARAGTRTALSRDEHTNHQTTTSPRARILLRLLVEIYDG